MTHEDILEMKRQYAEAVQQLAESRVIANKANRECDEKDRACDVLKERIEDAIKALYWPEGSYQ